MDALISKLKEEFGDSEFSSMQAVRRLYPDLTDRDRITNRRQYVTRQLQSWIAFGVVEKRRVRTLYDHSRIQWRIKI